MKGVCYLCQKDKKLTKEHIIPQALGGFLKASIYCSECNSNSGNTIDVALCASFSIYSTLLNVTRERGKNQPFTIWDDNNNLELEFRDGSFVRKNPVIGEPEVDAYGNITSIKIHARSQTQLEKIVSGVANSNGLDSRKFKLENIKMPPPSGEVDLILADNNIYRAIAKIAYGFACIKLPTDVVLSKTFENIRHFITGNSDLKCVGLNYKNTSFMTDKYRPLNKIHISFNRFEGLIIGYVAIYGAFRYTVLLGENFISNLEWSSIDYTSDPIRRKIIQTPTYFVAPKIEKNDVLQPKNTKQLLISALNSGLDIIATHSKELDKAKIIDSTFKDEI